MARSVANLVKSSFETLNYFSVETVERTLLQSGLSENGYCLFRNTNVHNDLFDSSRAMDTTRHLQRCLFGSDYDRVVNYDEGTDDRGEAINEVIQNVSVSTSSLYIPFHNELTYSNEFPRIVSFICIVAPDVGGQTLLSNNVRVYNDLSFSLKDKFIEFGVKYIQNLGSAESEHNQEKKTWQQLFKSNDKAVVEDLCTNHYDYDFEWRPNPIDNTEILRIKYNKPAIMEFDDGALSFANCIMGFHANYFDTGYYGAYKDIALVDRPHHCQWGNGDEFNDEQVNEINELFDKHTICFDWNEGDVVIADNFQWAHARNPYKGKREIIALFGVPHTRIKGTNKAISVSDL